jgi:hypothetical protein
VLHSTDRLRCCSSNGGGPWGWLSFVASMDSMRGVNERVGCGILDRPNCRPQHKQSINRFQNLNKRDWQIESANYEVGPTACMSTWRVFGFHHTDSPSAGQLHRCSCNIIVANDVDAATPSQPRGRKDTEPQLHHA